MIGLEIVELNKYGPLFNTGKVRPGSIIVSINNQAPSWENLIKAINNSFTGDEINFEILQNSKVEILKITTEASPS
jgi:S1-C subfamily serine protease